jgi:hypothetical protein
LQRGRLAATVEGAGAGRAADRRGPADEHVSFSPAAAGSYVLGVRCMGFQPVRRRVDVEVGQVVRAVVTMRPQPLDSLQ